MAAKVEVQRIIVTANRALKLATHIPIVAGDIEVDAVTFEFEESEDWQDLSLLAYFTNSASGITENAEYTRGAELKIPQAVTQDVGYIGVALLGVDIDNTDPENPVFIQRAATQACPNLLRVYQSGVVVYDPDPQSPIAPNILEQLNQTLAAAVAATEEAEHSISQHNDPFVGADEDTAGDKGLVPAPAAGEQDMVLLGSGEWGDVHDLIPDKADIDGYYELLTAGAADNLTGRGDSVEGSFLYRTAGGDADIADGIATIECVRGNTVRWNQLANWNLASVASGSPTTYSFSGNSVIFTLGKTLPDSSAANAYYCPLTIYSRANENDDHWNIIAGHKMLMKFDVDAKAGFKFAYGYRGAHHNDGQEPNSAMLRMINTGVEKTVNGVEHYSFLNTPTEDHASMCLYCNQRSNVAMDIGEQWTFSNCQLFDLTAMFGAGNEPSTIEEFEALYPLSYYEYNPGTLKPTMFEGVETVGFNQWDGTGTNGYGVSVSSGNIAASANYKASDYIPVFPNTQYCAALSSNPNSSVFGVVFYDIDKVFISGVTQSSKIITPTSPPNARYARITTFANDTSADATFNIMWSGYRNGEYEEYWKAQRAIAIAEHFPTGMKVAGTAADMLYKDHADHVIGEVDLGTFTYRLGTSTNYSGMWIAALGAEAANGLNIRCSKYRIASDSNDLNAHDKSLYKLSNATEQFIINDSALDELTPAEVKTALSGVMLYYELADSAKTTEVIDPPLNLGYKVSDFGTERVMLADGVISAPPIFEISYGLNAVDTIRRLPTEYISHNSFEQFTNAMVTVFDVGITESWDSVNERYSYVITPSQNTTDADVMNIVNEEWEG